MWAGSLLGPGLPLSTLFPHAPEEGFKQNKAERGVGLAVSRSKFGQPNSNPLNTNVLSGNPAKIVAELPESTLDIMVEQTKGYFQHFIGR